MIMLCLTYSQSNAQSEKDWPSIPGFTPTLPTTLTNRGTLIGVVSLAALSYCLEELVFKKQENINFYSTRLGMNNEYAWGLNNVWHQNVGIEHRVASWYSISAEFTLQEWANRTPILSSEDKYGIGLGLMSYFRWYLLGEKRISPYIEYGLGVFQGVKKFPFNGSKFTFNHSTLIGVEYTFKNESNLRLGYGNFNQTNYNLLSSNPSYNGNGFSIGYAFRINKKKS